MKNIFNPTCRCEVPEINHNDHRRIHGSTCVKCGKTIFLIPPKRVPDLEIEDIIISLELAMELKRLDVRQNSLFYWYAPNGNLGKITIESASNFTYPEGSFAAFTSTELGYLLPEACTTWKWHEGGKKGWSCKRWVCTKTEIDHVEMGETEAEVRAKMLIFLIKNRLVFQT